MAKYKPKERELSREQLQRRVDLVRGLMKIGARQMVDLEHTKGRLLSFDTEKGTVRALVYGFYDPNVKPLLVNIHGSGFVMGSAAMDDPFMMQFVHKCGVKVISIDYPLSPLVIAVSAPQVNSMIRERVGCWIRLAEKGDHKQLMIDTAENSYSPQYLKKYRKLYPVLGMVGKPADYGRFLVNANAILGFDAVGEIENIHCPTFIIGGAGQSPRKSTCTMASWPRFERM